ELPVGQTMALTGVTSYTLDGVTLNNEGTVNLRGELSLWGGTEFNNKGLLRAMAGGSNYVGMDGSTLNNSGVLEAIGDLSIINTSSSLFTNVGGTLASAPGYLDIWAQSSHSGAINITGSQVRFLGETHAFAAGSTVNGQLNLMGGTLSPGSSPGTLVINGDYTQGPDATLAIELGGTNQGVNYDLLQVTGTANLGGTLNVSFLGGFTGTVGDLFDVITYASRTGDFATFNFPAGASLTATPNAGFYQLLLNVPPPPPPLSLVVTTTLLDEMPLKLPAKDVRVLQDKFFAVVDAGKQSEDEEKKGAVLECK
ncbi:MAG: hypothetical protein Q8M53_18055, partial [Burkholderiales bacterium]|nr:hypothetical protein [Burkholderiales bacterium]